MGIGLRWKIKGYLQENISMLEYDNEILKITEETQMDWPNEVIRCTETVIA